MDEKELLSGILLAGLGIGVGTLIICAIAKSATGKQSTRSYALGVYDIFVGVFAFFWATTTMADQWYLSDAEEQIYSLVKWGGAIFAIVGAVEMYTGYRQAQAELEQERRNAELDRKRQEMQASGEEKIPAWKRVELAKEGGAAPVVETESNFCVHCGAPYKPGDAFCGKCGAKFESVVPNPSVIRRQTDFAQDSVKTVPMAQPKGDDWRCVCGRVNRRYVSTCACGRNVREGRVGNDAQQ